LFPLSNLGEIVSISALESPARPDTSTGGPQSAPRRRARLPDLRRWISPIALVLLWQLASGTGILAPDKLSSPWTVIRAGLDLIRSGELGEAFAVSIGRVGIGFLIGAGIALLLGILAGLSTWANVLIDPPVQMLRTLPFLGLIPLLILWFGIGEEPKIILVALGVSFPLYLNVHSGIRNVDDQLVEATTALGYTRLERLWHVILPSAVPQTLVGLRQSLGIAWLALIVGETVNADAGLGYLINNAREFLRTDVIVVGLIVYAALGLITDALVRLLERRALRWRAT
jgi:sulfonate transport system permease protein